MAIQPLHASSKSRAYPLRPGRGSIGKKILVKANQFLVELPAKHLHQYDVTITPEVTSRSLNRSVMRQLIELYRESHLGNRLPAYDGRKNVYTVGPLPFMSKEFQIILVDSARREKRFNVVINWVARIDLHHLEKFFKGTAENAPQEALRVLDIVLRECSMSSYSPVGRSFYSPRLRDRQQLGGGLESWRGFYQSIRPTQMGMSLNIDMLSTAFIEAQPVIDFLSFMLNKDICTRPLSNSDCAEIKKALKGVKVFVTHRGNMRRKYRIFGLTPQMTGDLSFPIGDRGTMISVPEYFLERYTYVIQFPQLPCLQVGNPKKLNYLPMEVCNIVDGQRFSRRLNEKKITALLRVTCQRPKDREKNILETVKENKYNSDEYAREFGIKIDEKLALVEARVLPPPLFKYHDTGKEKDCRPQVGQWNMKDKKFINGGTVNSWICINFTGKYQGEVDIFCNLLAQMCNTSGMVFKLEPVLPSVLAHPHQVGKVLEGRVNEAINVLQGREIDLVVVILPENNGTLYGDIKRICETDLGVIS